MKASIINYDFAALVALAETARSGKDVSQDLFEIASNAKHNTKYLMPKIEELVIYNSGEFEAENFLELVDNGDVDFTCSEEQSKKILNEIDSSPYGSDSRLAIIERLATVATHSSIFQASLYVENALFDNLLR